MPSNIHTVQKKVMKILIVEDKQIHRDSAVTTLKGNTLTIVGSYGEGMKALKRNTDYQLYEKLCLDSRHGQRPNSGSVEQKSAWDKQDRELVERATTYPDFDAVLVDMMMPMDRDTLAPGVFNHNEQVPYGFVLALRACQAGAKFVAMVTDTNHHKGALSAALDNLGSCYYSWFEDLFEINGARSLFIHAPFVEDGDAKDWGRVLEHLVNGPAKRSK